MLKRESASLGPELRTASHGGVFVLFLSDSQRWASSSSSSSPALLGPDESWKLAAEAPEENTVRSLEILAAQDGAESLTAE